MVNWQPVCIVMVIFERDGGSERVAIAQKVLEMIDHSDSEFLRPFAPPPSGIVWGQSERRAHRRPPRLRGAGEGGPAAAGLGQGKGGQREDATEGGSSGAQQRNWLRCGRTSPRPAHTGP